MDAEPPKVMTVQKPDSIQTSKGLLIKNFGSIICVLPGQWKLIQKKEYTRKNNQHRVYQMKDSDLKARFDFSAKKFPKENLEKFQGILDSNPHKLTKDEIESLKPLAYAQRLIPDYYIINGQSMKPSNGKVILLNGFSKKTGEFIMTFLYSDSKNETVPFELAFYMPKGDFLKHKDLVLRTIASTRWWY